MLTWGVFVQSGSKLKGGLEIYSLPRPILRLYDYFNLLSNLMFVSNVTEHISVCAIENILSVDLLDVSIVEEEPSIVTLSDIRRIMSALSTSTEMLRDRLQAVISSGREIRSQPLALQRQVFRIIYWFRDLFRFSVVECEPLEMDEKDWRQRFN